MRVNNRKPLRSSSRVAQPPSAVITGEGAGATQPELHRALRDLLAYQNRRGDEGWSSADVRRMNEIRDLAK